MTRQSSELIWLVARREIRDRARPSRSGGQRDPAPGRRGGGHHPGPYARRPGDCPRRHRRRAGGRPHPDRQGGRAGLRDNGHRRSAASITAARAKLRSGDLAAVLVGDSEILVKQQPLGGSFLVGRHRAGALSEVGGLQRLFALLPRRQPPGSRGTGSRCRCTAAAAAGGLASRTTGLGAAILIYVIILTYGVRITIGVGEEKATRLSRCC